MEEYIDIRVKVESDNILKHWNEAKQAAKELNIRLVKLGEIITRTCEVEEEKSEE